MKFLDRKRFREGIKAFLFQSRSKHYGTERYERSQIKKKRTKSAECGVRKKRLSFMLFLNAKIDREKI